MELHGTFPWNSMENFDAGISMEIGVLTFSMEFHEKCPNPPCKYFPWKSMEKFPWNSMEVFQTGFGESNKFYIILVAVIFHAFYCFTDVFDRRNSNSFSF